ncbi:hypothetical protein V8E36_009551 [Tilletia maclaganii]
MAMPLFRGISPGATSSSSTYPGREASSISSRSSSSASTTLSRPSAAAARLTARFGTLGSIAQGQSRTSLGRGTTLAAASQGCSSKGGGGHSGPIPPPRIKPIVFKNGITLVMDRRLLDKILVGKNIAPIFERIVEEERLRIRPAIGKGASAKEVTNIITTAFMEQGHDLIRDGWNGFEYCNLTATDHRLITIGTPEHPRQMFNAIELLTQYTRRECYIIVCSEKKFKPYDPLLFELMADELPDDEETDTGAQESKESRRAGKAKAITPELDFARCLFCYKMFSIDVHAEHEESCQEAYLKSQARSRSLLKVKEEPLAEEDSNFDENNSSEDDEDNACACGRPNHIEKTMVGCEGLGCETWWHESCADKAGFYGSVWFCPSCRGEGHDGGHGQPKHDTPSANPDSQAKKHKPSRSTSRAKRSSSRLKSR